MASRPRSLPLSISTVFALVGAVVLGLLLIAACDLAPTQPLPAGTSTPAAAISPSATAPAQSTPTNAASPSATTVADTATSTSTPSPSSTPTQSPTATATSTSTPLPTEAVLDYTWSRVGLTSTNLTGLAVTPGGGGVVVAGAKGVWSSTYSYKHWTQLNPKLGGQTTDAAIASAGVLYVTSHTGCASGLPITASRSTDGGKSWQEMSKLDAISIVPAGSTTAYAATCSGMMKTTDSGATWTALPNMKVINLDPIAVAVGPDGATVYVAFVSEGGAAQILRSTDGGNTATNITPALQQGQTLQAPITLTFIAATEGRPAEGGLYMTSYTGFWFLPDGSDSWKQLSVPRPQGTPTGNSAYSFFTAIYIDTNYSAEYNKPGAIIYTALGQPAGNGLTNIGIFRSTDLGNTWAIVSKGLQGKAVNALALAPGNPSAAPATIDTLLAATNDGVWSVPLPPPFK